MVIAGIPCTMPAIWIGLIVICLIVEGLTAGLVTIWFAVGALAGALSLTTSTPTQAGTPVPATNARPCATPMRDG